MCMYWSDFTCKCLCIILYLHRTWTPNSTNIWSHSGPGLTRTMTTIVKHFSTGHGSVLPDCHHRWPLLILTRPFVIPVVPDLPAASKVHWSLSFIASLSSILPRLWSSDTTSQPTNQSSKQPTGQPPTDRPTNERTKASGNQPVSKQSKEHFRELELSYVTIAGWFSKGIPLEN